MKLLICIFAIAAVTMADETDIEETFSKGNEQFTAKLFSEVVKSNPGKSVVLSAFSVMQPLAQLGLASVGDSHDELLKAIGLPNDDVAKAAFPLVNGKLRSIKGIELKMANKIYIPNGSDLNPEFAEISRKIFGSEVKNVDFTKNVETAKEINTWVEEQTNNRIKDLVEPDSLGSDTQAVLVNAIYFKGKWYQQFNVNATTDRDFHVSKDKTIKLPTMYNSGTFKYGESKELNAKLLELPYDDEESSFLIILPNEIEGITALEEKLKSPSLLTKAVENMRPYQVDVYLPKFKIETTTDLLKVLSKIGVQKLFDPIEAKLDKLLKGESGLHVSQATQKAFIEVNEEGAEAAAANEFAVYRSSKVLILDHRSFVIDRPFYYTLKYKTTRIFNGVFIS